MQASEERDVPILSTGAQDDHVDLFTSCLTKNVITAMALMGSLWDELGGSSKSVVLHAYQYSALVGMTFLIAEQHFWLKGK